MSRYTIYSLQLAHKLIKQGFELVGTGVNVKNPRYLVYYFENTDELQRVVKEYTTQH